LEFSIMRSWKVAFAAIAVAVIVIAFLVLRRGDALIGGTAGAATPNPATIAMPVPVTKIVKKAVPIYLDYSARADFHRQCGQSLDWHHRRTRDHRQR
jgi:membrane fusion protein, multidrug efflux system